MLVLGIVSDKQYWCRASVRVTASVLVDSSTQGMVWPALVLLSLVPPAQPDHNIQIMQNQFGFISEVLESLLFGFTFKVDSVKNIKINTSHYEDGFSRGYTVGITSASENNTLNMKKNKSEDQTKKEKFVNPSKVVPIASSLKTKQNFRHKTIIKHQRGHSILNNTKEQNSLKIILFQTRSLFIYQNLTNNKYVVE